MSEERTQLECLEELVNDVANEMGSCFLDPEDKVRYAERVRRVATILNHCAEDLILDYEGKLQ